MATNVSPETPNSEWDHTSDQNFVAFYERQSLTPETEQRFTTIRDKSLHLLTSLTGQPARPLHVADIGCGTGGQAMLWAKLGHDAWGIDVNAALIDIANRRAQEAGMNIRFDVGSATSLPYPDVSMDVVLMPELLEHVADWECCVNEGIRVLKPGGLLYLSTTNWLCPIQQEFNLPMYSWYPGIVKRRFERLAVTTRPEIANYCRYPAVNWFSYHSLAAYLEQRHFRCFDRFDMIETNGRSLVTKAAVTLIRTIPLIRLIGHVLTPGSTVFSVKDAE